MGYSCNAPTGSVINQPALFFKSFWNIELSSFFVLIHQLGCEKMSSNFVQDYSDAATVHGVSYICQRDQSAPHRLLWLLIVSMGVFVTRMRISFEDSSSGDDDFLQGQNSSKVNLIVTARDCSSFATKEGATKIQKHLNIWLEVIELVWSLYLIKKI